MHFWYDYRTAWALRPWIVIIAVVAVAMVLAGIVGTVTGSPLLFFFIPGLAALYIHHLIVVKIVD